MITTVIFDLDGLLADTEKLHCRAYQEVLAGYGYELTKEAYSEHWIRRGAGIDEFIREHNVSIDPESIRLAKADVYRQLVVSSVEPMPGAIEVLSDMWRRKKLALATSSYQDAAAVVTRTLDIARYFSCIATRANVLRIKPFPDLFVYAARMLGTVPGHSLVVEDSEKGIIAAHAAGMKSIAIPNEETLDHDFTKATLVLNSLSSLTRELIDAL
jgi:HAD superfamily hydrolase (TIGR01509 family)